MVLICVNCIQHVFASHVIETSVENLRIYDYTAKLASEQYDVIFLDTMTLCTEKEVTTSREN